MATEETKANVENEEQKAQQKAEPQTKQDKKKQDKKGFEARIEALEKEKKELEEKAAEAADARLRLMAEFENFRRRNTQEKLDLVATAAKDTIEGLLPILDDCERALKALASSEDSAAAKEGTELIYSKLMAYLKSKGLEPIDAIGKPFDTDLHEAVAQFPVPEEDKKGKVFDVVQTGYTLSGKVIRYAKVVVAI